MASKLGRWKGRPAYNKLTRSLPYRGRVRRPGSATSDRTIAPYRAITLTRSGVNELAVAAATLGR